MVKKKSSEVKEISAKCDWSKLSKCGIDLLEDVESVSTWIDTGILALNYICSGSCMKGLPSQKIIEIFGDSATGKSLIGTNILRGVQKIQAVPVLLDAERAVSKEFAVKASKIDPKKFFIIEADTLESCFAKIYSTIRNIRGIVSLETPIFIVYDSIASSPSCREFAETTLDLETATQAEIKEAGAGADKPGERAKICSKEFRKLPAFLKENNASLIVINQLRQKIGVMYGPDTIGAGGGRALEYYSTIRLRLTANKSPRDDKNNILGVNVNIQNVKNRCFRPYVEAQKINLLFEQGINPFGGLLTMLLQINRIEGSNGNYTVKEPWAAGKTIKFKASKERNDVPASLLLECPALVDAESPEQIQYYVDLYQSAIDAVEHDIASQSDIDEDMLG